MADPPLVPDAGGPLMVIENGSLMVIKNLSGIGHLFPASPLSVDRELLALCKLRRRSHDNEAGFFNIFVLGGPN